MTPMRPGFQVVFIIGFSGIALYGAACFDHLPDGLANLLKRKWLAQVQVAPLANEGLRLFVYDVTSDKNDAFSGFCVKRAELLVNLLPIQARHAPVANHRIVTVQPQPFQCGLAIAGHLQLDTARAERVLDQRQDRLFVVNDQHALASTIEIAWRFEREFGLPRWLRVRRRGGKL